MTKMERVQDLVDEAKRRTILWAIFVSGLAYLLSLTSSSVWINIPIATLILAVLRYLSFELEIRKRVQALHIPSHLSHLLKHQISLEDPLLCSPSPVSTWWRRKIDSPIVEAALDDFTGRIVQEFVTDLWYSSLTPDQDVPEQLRLLINDVFGEIAQRIKRINLINLLTRDVVDLVGSHLDLFRQAKATVGAKVFGTLSSEEREERLKLALLKKKQLHPALFSPELECKVLQQLMSGVIAILLRPQDAQCPLMRCLARELLACAVLRPIMNFASPSFINKTIEQATLSAKEKSQSKKSERSEMDESLSGRSSKGNVSRPGSENTAAMNSSSDDPLKGGTSKFLETEPRPSNRTSYTASAQDGPSTVYTKQGDWAQVLEVVSQRRTRTLAPENLDNLWAKGRNYKKKELQRTTAKPSQATSRTNEVLSRSSLEKQDLKPPLKDSSVKRGVSKANQVPHLGDMVKSVPAESSTALKETRPSSELPKSDKSHDSVTSSQMYKQGFLGGDGAGIGMHYDGPCEINQGGRSGSLNMDFQVTRHPLENPMDDALHKHQERHVNEPLGTDSHHRRSRSSSTGLDGWQKLENSATNQDNSLHYWDAPGMHISSGSSQVDPVAGWLNDPAVTTGQSLSVRTAVSKLNCWVVGAHLEKAESKTFAVYSIAVTDSDNTTWFVERRFRNFEQLHRHLRDLPQYNLQLPPKRFLSSSLDDSFVRDRCILLDKYLKDLLSIPSIAELHEVWDFLSVTSKRYSFTKSPSVMKTFAVNVDDAVDDMFRQLKGVSDGILRRVGGPPSPSIDGGSPSASGCDPKPAGSSEAAYNNNVSWVERDRSEHLSDDEYSGLPGVAEEESAYLVEGWHSDSELQEERQMPDSISNALAQQRISDYERRIERVGSDALSTEESTAGSEIFEAELAVPPEWTPPKLTVPLLNLVDGIFQLQGRGWIRRQVFWMAKQILQLGMGDAVDDWLVAQIQWLRREDVVASVIRWVQGTLWPGGIFISKKKKSQEIFTPDSSSGRPNNQAGQRGMDQSAFFESQLEATRCASVVHEIIVEGAPAALVSLIGKKQYTRCAKDIYYFLQSTVFLKQLTYSLLEILLTATFPELSNLILDVRQGPGQVLI